MSYGQLIGSIVASACERLPLQAAGSAYGRGLILCAPQLGVDAAPREQVRVRALLGEPARAEDEDAVYHRRRQPMRDGDDGSALRELLKRPVDGGLGLRVECGRRLVQHENRGLADECARDGDALPLAT